MQKLNYVAGLMRRIRAESPAAQATPPGDLLNPVEGMTLLLAAHNGHRAERYRALAQGYVDDKLREAFPARRAREMGAAVDLILPPGTLRPTGCALFGRVEYRARFGHRSPYRSIYALQVRFRVGRFGCIRTFLAQAEGLSWSYVDAAYINTDIDRFDEDVDGFINLGVRLFWDRTSFTITGFRPLTDDSGDFIAFPVVMLARHW